MAFTVEDTHQISFGCIEDMLSYVELEKKMSNALDITHIT